MPPVAERPGLGRSMMSITCRCGHTADIELFIHNGLGQPLPHGHFQCPACRWAFKRELVEGKKYPSGYQAPSVINLKTVPSEL